MQQTLPNTYRKRIKIYPLKQGADLVLSNNNVSMDNLPLAYQLLDEQDRILNINNAWLNLTGYTRQEVIGRCFHEFCIPSPAQEQPAAWRQFMLSGHIDALPLLLRHKNKAPVPVSLGGNIAFNPGRTSFRLHCILHRRNEQKDFLAAAPAGQHLGRALFDAAPCSLACIGKDGRIFYANSRFIKLFYGNQNSVDKKYWFNILPEKLHKKHASLLADCFAGNQASFLDAGVLAASPDVIWLSGSYSPFSRITGEVEYVIFTAMNVNEQVGLEHQLADVERLGKIGRWQWNRQEKVFNCSEGLKSLFNLPPEISVTYQDLLQRLQPQDLIRFRQSIRRLIEQRVPIDWEFSLPAAGTSRRILHGVISLSLGKGDRKASLAGTLKDITADRELDDLRRETALRLREFAQTIADMSFIIDEEGTVLETFGNENLPFLGSSIQPAGKKLSVMMSKKNADLLLSSIHKALTQKTLQFGEFEIYSDSGKRLFEVRVAPMSYKINGLRTASCTAMDITDENRTKRILQLSYERRQRRDLLNNLIERKTVPSQLILDQAWRLRLNLAQPFSCFLAVIKQWQEQPMTHWQEHRAEIQFVIDSLIEIFGGETNAIVWESKEGIGLIYPWRPPFKDIRRQELAVAQNLKEIASNHFPDLYLTIGIAEFHPDSFQKLPDMYNQARDAAYLGQSQSNETDICHYLDLGVFQILPFVNNREQAETFIRRSLGGLLEYDQRKGSQLVDTLEKILRSGNLKLVAEQSFVHYKTIVFRKKRIEKILNVSLDDFETKLTLCTALKLKELLQLNI